MKRYFIYMVMVVATLFASCATDTTDTPEMVEVGDIEVQFSVDGNQVSKLNLASVSHTIKVDVALNNDNIYWTPVSDKEWCQVVEETHRGSGSFTLKINANESFDARENATITFVAGGYSVSKLTVAHNGNVFILNQVYAASTKAAGSATISVKTIEGVEWDTDCDSWFTATKGASSTADGITTTELNISWEANDGISRYGEVRFVKNGSEMDEGWFNVWQYGSDVNYDADGNILLEAQNATPLELRAPKQTIKDVVMPSWVSYTTEENNDGTVSYMLSFADNPSDAQHIRSTNLALSLLSGAANISLPVIKQEYYAMEGLLTGPGLQLFAKTWNEGGDISQWCINGVPTLVGDIDMTEATEWIAIGTEAHPWTGEFKGNGKKLINFNASQPLFGFVRDAKISELTLDSSVQLERTSEYGETLYMAALAGSIENTTIENCNSSASVTLDAATNASGSKSYVAGLVGKVDATSKISYCNVRGAVTVKSSCTTVASDNKFYVGGLAAHNAGTIEDSFSNSALDCNAIVRESYVGGIAGYTSTSSILLRNTNAGAITFGASRGGSQSLYAHIGGIAGRANGEISSCNNDGDITSTSAVQNIYIGGIAGSMADPNLKLSHNNQGNSSDLNAGGKSTIKYVGGIAGYVEAAVPVVMDFNADSSTVGGTAAGNNLEYVATAVGSVGGYFGYCAGDVTLTAPKWTGTASYTMLNEPHTIKEINCGGLIGQIAGKLNITSAEIGAGSSVWTKYEATSTGAANNTIKMRGNLGGMVGKCEGEVSISNSVNNAAVEWGYGVKSLVGATSNRQNSSACFVGGFVGQITNVEANIENCDNKGRIYNHSYNNNAYSTALTMNCTGGIVGGHGAVAGANKALTLKNCSNSTPIDAIRGFVAGIAGYAANATIEECNYLNGRITDDQNCYMAGIIGGAMNSTVSNCSATTNLTGYNGGSCYVRAGGIVAWSMGTTTVEKCKYFGDITATTVVEGQFFGGIVGLADDENTVIKACQYGGTILGMEINSNNCEKFTVGMATNFETDSDAQVNDITYWNGK